MKEIKYKERDKKTILERLYSGRFEIFRFPNGYCFYDKQLGICADLIDEETLIEMIREKLINPSGTILKNGLKIISE